MIALRVSRVMDPVLAKTKGSKARLADSPSTDLERYLEDNNT
jgi:hypothetical protein